MKQLAYILLFFLIAIQLRSQQQEFRLVFTSDDNGYYVSFDSIYIKNLDQAGDTTLIFPDTVLDLGFAVGLEENLPQQLFSTAENYPNPFTGSTALKLHIPEQDMVSVHIYDLTGRSMAAFSEKLDQGSHSFRFITAAKGMFVARISYRQEVKSIKMICSNTAETASSLLYEGHITYQRRLKNQGLNNFAYSTGDRLMCIMYAEGIESGSVKKPYSSDTIIMQFASGIPCLEEEEINYMGQNYGTVQIRGQCWMNENMNAGMMIAGSEDPSDNGLIEKYCYDDDPARCNVYGGLYQWQEIMAYTEEPGARGICPPGWHVPSDEEWIILEGVADNMYNIRDPIWNVYELRGFDAGYQLKSTGGWNDNGNGSDAFGFNALAAGTRSNFGNFILMGRNAPFWSSSMFSEYEILYRILLNHTDKVYRYDFEGDSGFALRCVKN